jgi:hypothetical protein
MALKVILLGLFTFATTAFSQGTFAIFDQVNTNFAPAQFHQINSNGPIGQEFTPSLNAVGFVDLNLGSDGAGSTIWVNLRTDSIGGAILGTTESIELSPAQYTIGRFNFSQPVPVVPGRRYVFEVVASGGAAIGNHDSTRATAFSTYPHGDMILSGAPFDLDDLWFQEGMVVPEPKSGLFLLMGITLAWKFLPGKNVR